MAEVRPSALRRRGGGRGRRMRREERGERGGRGREECGRTVKAGEGGRGGSQCPGLRSVTRAIAGGSRRARRGGVRLARVLAAPPPA